VLTEKQLRETDVRQWPELRKEFEGAELVLGNGFSIKLAAQFSYSSLFEKFLTRCDPAARKLFAGLDTTNFEEIQRLLLDAKRVAELLDSPLAGIDGHVNSLREGLINVIHDSHPRAAEIDKDRLQEISKDLDVFGDIFTTNYDLFLYHIIMICKDRGEKDPGVRPYNDYFWNRVSGKFLEFMGFQNYKHYKHAYFLHGALFIFPGPPLGRELKLRRGDDWELLDAIDDLIRAGDLPLFVTEGTARQKMRAITQSAYLRFAMDKLGKARESLLIYGCALGDPDRHVVNALNSQRRSLAVSIYVGEKTQEAIEAEVKAIRGKLGRHDVVVFDSRGLF